MEKSSNPWSRCLEGCSSSAFRTLSSPPFTCRSPPSRFSPEFTGSRNKATDPVRLSRTQQERILSQQTSEILQTGLDSVVLASCGVARFFHFLLLDSFVFFSHKKKRPMGHEERWNRQRQLYRALRILASALKSTRLVRQRRTWCHAVLLTVAVVSATSPVLSQGGDWQSLFDGKTLKGWKITDFAGHGEVNVENGQLLLHSGLMLTGVSWTNEIPKSDYEVALEAMKVDGGDFFCGLTFPVKDAFCTWIIGGWGGGVVGLSSIDGLDASENETTKYMKFDAGRWYHIRLRVRKEQIEAWIDDEKIADQSIVRRRISLRPGD